MDNDIETLADAGSSPGSDGTPGSSAPNDAKEGADSSSEQGAKKPTLSEALDKVRLEEPEEESGEAEGSASEQAEESPTAEQDAQAGEADADEAAETKDGRSAAEGKADGSLNQGWDKTPEWSGILKLTLPEKRGEVIKTIRPLFERAHKAEDLVRQLKPEVALVNEFRQYAGDEAGFTQMRDIIRAYATEPAKSVPVLERMLQDAKARAGLVVTSDDLKARLTEIDEQLASGEITEAVAEKWKADVTAMEQTRAGNRQTTERLEQEKASQQQRSVKALAQARETALNDWEAKIRETEPSFGEMTEADDPKHGLSLADDVFDGLTLFSTRNRNATPAQLVAEAKRVLALAKAKRGQTRRQQRVITTESSSINAKRKPRNVMDAMNNVRLEQ